MFDPDAKDEEGPPPSLLSLSRGGDAVQRRPASRPLLSVATAEPPPAERHRLARSRREAAPNPLLRALAQQRPGAGALEAIAAREADGSSEGTDPDRSDIDVDAPMTRHQARARGVRRRGLAHPGGVAGDAASPGVAARWQEPAPSPADGAWRPLIDPAKIIGGIVRSRWIILACTVAGAMLGVAIALSTPKQYESVAELLVDPRDIKVSDRNVTEGSLPSDATLAIVENQVRVLMSGTVLNKVVDRLNLQNDREFNGQGGGFGLGQIVSELRSLLSRRDAAGGGDVRRALAVRNLAESLEVERGGKTFVVSVAATTESAEKSALIANTVTQVFLETSGDIQSDTAGKASDELTSRLAELQAGVEDAERKVETYKAENDLVDAQGRLITDDEMVKLNDQLSIARARTIELNARAQSARGLNLDSVVGGELPEQLASPVMAELRTQYATIKQETDRLASRLGPRHPERMAAEAQLAGARDSLAAELRRIVSSIQVDLRRAVQLEQDLASRLAQLKARQGAVSEDLVTLRELEREAAAQRAVYESFLLRARETGEQRGLNTANVSVISPAQPPLDPLGPSRAMVTIAATMLGFMAGIGIGGVRGAVDSLRSDGAPRPAAPARPAVPARRRRQVPDEIDRIMQQAAARNVEEADPKPGKAEAERASGTRPDTQPPSSPNIPRQDEPMHPANPYAYPFQPQPQAAPRWPDPHAAWAAQQEAMRQHAANAAALQQAAMVDAAMRAGYAPQAYPQSTGYPQQPMPYAPQPIGYAPPPAYPAYASPPPAYPQPWPQPPQAYQPQQPEPARQPRQELSAVDEIRESLREFREAVRDLTERRARGRDY